MRDACHVTMLDPFQEKYGTRIGAILCLPVLVGELLWAGAPLLALGSTISVLLGIGVTVSVMVSAGIAVSYTLIGGLYSVAYTDVIQLSLMFVGLFTCIPFAMSSSYVGHVESDEERAVDWIGTIESKEYGYVFDNICLLIFGSIPTQMYYQRVLSAKDSRRAQVLSYAGAVACFVFAVPTVWIGAIAKSTDWPNVPTFARNISSNEYPFVLPLVLHHLTPPAIAYIGLGAISAAVMSSADSNLLSCSTNFARNFYKGIARQTASEREIVLALRIATLASGVIATTIALSVTSLYGILVAGSDIMYVSLFPQLVCLLYAPRCNVYGALAGFLGGIGMRLAAGEPLLGLPSIVADAATVRLVPFRTMIMLVSLALIVGVSCLAETLALDGAAPQLSDERLELRATTNTAITICSGDDEHRVVAAEGRCEEVRLMGIAGGDRRRVKYDREE